MTSSNIEFKAMPGQFNIDEAQGIVECFVAGIGNKDSVGDVLVTGAFSKSLMRRKPRVVWGHNWNDPIGKVLEIYEVAPGDRRLPAKMLNAGIGGLYAKVQFNLNSEKGKEAFSNVAFFGQDQEWSIGYKTLDSIFDPSMQANVLKEVELYEVSPVLHGANQLTGTISVKSEDSSVSGKWGMMGHHAPGMSMPGAVTQQRQIIMIAKPAEDDEKPIFSEGLAQPIAQEQRERLQREISSRTGSSINLIEATENTAVFSKLGPNGQSTTYRIGYHTPDNYVTFMFGKPEVANNFENNNPTGSRIVIPSQMPSMPMNVKPNYESHMGPIMPKSENGEKSDLAEQIQQLEELLIDELDEKVGKTINKRNLSKLKTILENLQEVISSAEKEDMETKGYLIPVQVQEAFHTKSLLDPIFDYHRVESIVTEDGILITSGVTKDLVEAIDNAQKGIGRSLGGGLGKGRAAGRAAFATFDPKAWDGDNDGIVQEGTPFERPAIPGVNDFNTRGKVNVRRVLESTNGSGFASSSGTKLVEDRAKNIDNIIDRAARRIIGNGNETDATNRYGEVYSFFQEEYDNIVADLQEIFSPLSRANIEASPGKTASELRKNLVEKLSDEKFIEKFNNKEHIDDFIDSVTNGLTEAFSDRIDEIKRTGTASDVKEAEDFLSDIEGDFTKMAETISDRAKDFWSKRKERQLSDPYWGRTSVGLKPEQAKEDAKNWMDDLIHIVGNGLEGNIPDYDNMDFAKWLASRDNHTIISSMQERIRNGEIDPQDLQYELEMVLEHVQNLDPTLQPEDLTNQLKDALKKGGEKNPILKEISDSWGEEQITGGDLIDALREIQKNSVYRPERGKAEKERLRGFASRSSLGPPDSYFEPPEDDYAIEREIENMSDVDVFENIGGEIEKVDLFDALWNSDEPGREDRTVSDFLENMDSILEIIDSEDYNWDESDKNLINKLKNASDEERKKILTDIFNKGVASKRDKNGNPDSPEGYITDALVLEFIKNHSEGNFKSNTSYEEMLDYARERTRDDLTRDYARSSRSRARGFASRSGRITEDNNADNYDEAFGPVERGPGRGMPDDPVGELAAEMADRELGRRGPGYGFASSSNTEKEIDMTLGEYADIQKALDGMIQKLDSGDLGADEEIQKLQELSDKIDLSHSANDSIPLTNEELNNYLGILESAVDQGIGLDGASDKERNDIESLVGILKDAQKNGSVESEALKKAGTRLSSGSARSAQISSRGRKYRSSTGTFVPKQKLEITLDDDTIALLVEEADGLMDYTRNKQPILAMKKKLQDAKNGKFEVTPEEFVSINSSIDDAIDNGVVTSDIAGVLGQAADAVDGKYDINQILNPQPRKGFASTGRKLNNGAPTDITEAQQKEYVNWARQQRGLRVAQEIIRDHDKNNGQLKSSQWKALRTMYGSMGPGSARGGSPRSVRGFASSSEFRRDNTLNNVVRPLPYTYQTSGWKKVGGAGGLNEASRMQDPKTGKTYYVKHTRQGEEFRGETEILTSKLYQLLGVDTIPYERGEHNGKLQRVSEWNPGIHEVDHSRLSKDPAFKASVQRSLIANAWLANWDGTGNISNIVQGPNGEAIMADSGGGLVHRAQRYSGMKGQGGTDSFGPVVEEVHNLINGKTRGGQSVQGTVSRLYYHDIPQEEVARQVKELSQVTDEDIKKLAAQTISDPAQRDQLADILIARRDWIADHWKTGKFEKPEDTSRSDASAARARAFASTSSRPRVFASSSMDASGDDDRGGGRVGVRDLGQAVPSGALDNGRRREIGVEKSKEGAQGKFVGKSFDEVKPDSWDEMTMDEKWEWVLGEGNPDNGGEMSYAAHSGLMKKLTEEEEKADMKNMSREERAARKREIRDLEGRTIQAPEKKQPEREPVARKPKVKASATKEQARKEREDRLDRFNAVIDEATAKLSSGEYEGDVPASDDHADMWNELSTAIQDSGSYDFGIDNLDKGIEILDEYVSNFEDEKLTKEEKYSLTAAKKMLKELRGLKEAYSENEWIRGGKKKETKPEGLASTSAAPKVSYNRELATNVRKEIKKMQGSGKGGGPKGFASTSSGGKTMITDEATFFKDVESSLDKEIRKARTSKNDKAAKGLQTLLNVIRNNEASKTGSRRTNAGSIYMTADEADDILEGLMFALDGQVEAGGEKRIEWYSKLIDKISQAAMSTFIDKNTREITSTTRTGTNSRGQKRTINIVPEA